MLTDSGKNLILTVTKKDFFVRFTDIKNFFGKSVRNLFRGKRIQDCIKFYSRDYISAVHTFARCSTWVHHEVVRLIFRLTDETLFNQFSLDIDEMIKNYPLFTPKTDPSSKKRKKIKLLNLPYYLYGYPCNSVARNGDSLTNSLENNHSRTNGHGVVIPRLAYEYIIYMPKDIIIEIRGLLKKTFPRETANRDFFNVEIEEINNFILYFCVTRNVKYTSVNPKLLEEYNDSL